eukprot:MONOS_5379.1-p1 / transcript=MONOS_5379.1 / gene=MONOS_5379 / organism=Monocercomonoides_exilis_PA203 / gene_product=unspecified product / transcript_product=unspecified product / location=Mono_scaffold00155:99383-100835(+) / protein_length=342 / sequence_SO=supercontig / SO=protein_coding / is_pseudo=false
MIQSIEKFEELLAMLEKSSENEQKRVIEEMNIIIEKMDSNELFSVLTEKMLNRVDGMIEEKIFSFENTILFLSQMGYFKTLKDRQGRYFNYSLLCNRIRKMIIYEGQKKDEKNEKLLVDLCECYLFFNEVYSSELFFICVPCLLKASLNKEESEEAQRKVEMALVALDNISQYKKIEKGLYLNEIKEILKYHQEHRNLTRLAYQSAWKFLINRLYNDESLEEMSANELHFAREASRELDELSKCVDWKRKEEKGKKGRDWKDMTIIKNWLQKLNEFFLLFPTWKEECDEVIRLKRKAESEIEEANRRPAKMKLFEELEEEGYEDIITSLYRIILKLDNFVS